MSNDTLEVNLGNINIIKIKLLEEIRDLLTEIKYEIKGK